MATEDGEIPLLLDELQRWRTGARYLLAQRGDDLCWRDWYVWLGGMLGDEVAVQAAILSCPSKAVQLHNCDRYIDSLLAPSGQAYKADDKDTIIAKLTARVWELEAQLRERRQ